MIEVFVQQPKEIGVKIGSELVPVGDYEHYGGEYSVTPKFENQKLNTKNKVMDFDIDVKPIPVIETPNPSGGLTVIIGG